MVSKTVVHSSPLRIVKTHLAQLQLCCSGGNPKQKIRETIREKEGKKPVRGAEPFWSNKGRELQLFILFRTGAGYRIKRKIKAGTRGNS